MMHEPKRITYEPNPADPESIAIVKRCQVANPWHTRYGTSYRVALLPEDCARILAYNNKGQRNLRKVYAYGVRRMMIADCYACMHDCVLGHRGDVIDGQHRFFAASGAFTDDGAPVVFHATITIAHAAHEDLIKHTLDCGLSRNVGDMIRIATNGELRLHASVYGAISLDMTSIGGGLSGTTITKPMVSQRAIAEPFLPTLMELSKSHNKRAKAPVMAAALACLRINDDDAETFFSAIVAGDPVIRGEYSPAANLLIRWLSEYEGTERRAIYARCILAWNSWRKKTPMKILRWSGPNLPTPV